MGAAARSPRQPRPDRCFAGSRSAINSASSVSDTSGAAALRRREPPQQETTPHGPEVRPRQARANAHRARGTRCSRDRSGESAARAQSAAAPRHFRGHRPDPQPGGGREAHGRRQRDRRRHRRNRSVRRRPVRPLAAGRRCAAAADAAGEGARHGTSGREPGRRARRRLAYRRLPVQEPDGAQELRAPEVPAAGRVAEAAGLGQGDRPEGRRAVRRPRRRRQGRHHQALHGESQSTRSARRRAGEADRAGARPVVLPALRRAPAHGRRDHAVRPLLVQPGGRRAGDGLLHAAGIPRVHAPGAGVRADAGPQQHPPREVLVLGQPRRAAPPVQGAPRPPVEAVEAVADRHGVARQVGRLHQGEGGDVLLHRHRRRAVDGERRRCSSTPTPPTRRGR